MARALTATASLTCQHGGTLVIVPSQQIVTVGRRPLLVLADLLAAAVAGCPLGPKPCTKVTAVARGAAATLTIGSAPVVLESASGTTDQGTFQVVSAGQTILDAT